MRKLLLLAMMMNALIAFAADEDTRLATVREGTSHFAQQIDIPSRVPNGSFGMGCASTVNHIGRMGRVVCRWEDIDTEVGSTIYDRIVRASRRVRFHPAKLDGVQELVWYSFSVGILKTNVETRVRVYEHQFQDTDKYGDNYQGAQRVLKGYPAGCNLEASIMVQLEIDASGEPSNVRIIDHHADETERCLENVKEHALQGPYIPANFEGRAVSSTYLQLYSR